MNTKSIIFGFVITLIFSAGIAFALSNSGDEKQDDSSIKMPEELPTGQKLVKTGGEEIIHENMGRHFPHYISCNAYIYSVKPTYAGFSIDQTSIAVCAFNSENDAKSDLQNLIINNQNILLLSDYVNEHEKELEIIAPAYLDCDIPNVCMIGEFDGILFPIRRNIVWISSDKEVLLLPEIAETVYALNVEATPTPKPIQPNADAVYLDYQNINDKKGRSIFTDVKMKDTHSTFYSVFSWTAIGENRVAGYYGIQSEGGNPIPKHLHFTIWDPLDGGETTFRNEDNDVNCEHISDIEGKYTKCTWEFDWSENKVYRLKVEVSTNDDSTFYDAYFYDDDKTKKHLVTIEYPMKNRWD